MLAAVVVLAACTTDPGVRATNRQATDAPASAIDPVVEWGECDDPAASDPDLQCGTLEVPLDWSDVEGDKVILALVRAPATGERKGAILFNPGGPGGSGFDPIAYNGTYFQRELGLGDFDLVGFDPRGVDRSGGIECVDDDTLDKYLYLDDTPDTPDEEALLDEADNAFIDGCAERYGDTLRHYSTEATARDMDAIRAALGDEQVAYFGISYGTYLGAVYATLFPDRVMAMVLDSAYEPNGDTGDQQWLTQLVGFEQAFDDWVAWCEGDDTCAFTAGDVGERWDALRLELDEHPLTADGRTVNQATLDTATSASLYSPDSWSTLAAALADAEDGKGGAVLSLADEYNGRHPDGTFDTIRQSNPVISCASGIRDAPIDDPEGLLAKIREQAPRFGADITLDDLTDTTDDCDQLTGPVEAVEISYAGDGPVVVIGGLGDPATPIRWAEEMSAELGPNARMVTYTGEGHGQLLTSECIDDIERALFNDRRLPDPDAICDPDPPVAEPDWWADMVTPTGHTPSALPSVASALGLSPTLGYGEIWVTADDAQTAADAWAATLADLGFDDNGEQDIGIAGSVSHGFIDRDGVFVFIIALGPESFTDESLAGAASTVPPGRTVVVVAYLP